MYVNKVFENEWILSHKKRGLQHETNTDFNGVCLGGYGLC